MTTLTKVQINEIVLRVDAGDAMSTIAEDISTSPEVVRAAYLAWEREQRRVALAAKGELSLEQTDEAIRLIRSGWSSLEVGFFLNVDAGLVRAAWEAWKAERLRRAHAYRRSVAKRR